MTFWQREETTNSGIRSGFYRGFFVQDGRCWPVVAEFDISEGHVHGCSWDGPGPAILNGWVVANRWLFLLKAYERYSVLLIGRQRSRGIISGRWRIGLFHRGLFEFWPDERADEDLVKLRQQAMMPMVMDTPTPTGSLPPMPFPRLAGPGGDLMP